MKKLLILILIMGTHAITNLSAVTGNCCYGGEVCSCDFNWDDRGINYSESPWACRFAEECVEGSEKYPVYIDLGR